MEKERTEFEKLLNKFSFQKKKLIYYCSFFILLKLLIFNCFGLKKLLRNLAPFLFSNNKANKINFKNMSNQIHQCLT